MTHPNEIAERVASRLIDDLKAKRIEVINIDVIRAELRKEPDCPKGADQFNALEEKTTRRVVEKVG